jgi:hypothetical protein
MKNGVSWVLTRATRRNNPEDTIFHSLCFISDYVSVLELITIFNLFIHWAAVERSPLLLWQFIGLLY